MQCNNCKHDIPLNMAFAYSKGACPFCGSEFLSDSKGLAIQQFYNKLFECFGTNLEIDKTFTILGFLYSPGSEIIIESLKNYGDAFNEISKEISISSASTVVDVPIAADEAKASPPNSFKPPKPPVKKVIRRSDSSEDDSNIPSAPMSNTGKDYSIPESEIIDLPEQLQSLARNVKTKADYDLLMKMVAETMVLGDRSGN